MSILKTIQLNYQKIIGDFLKVKPILFELKKICETKKEYKKYLPEINNLLIQYEPVFSDLTKLLEQYSKIKKGEFSITTLIPSFVNFSNKANYLIKRTSELEIVIRGNSSIRPVNLIPSYIYFLIGAMLGFLIKKSK